MPPKFKFTKKEIVDAAFDIVRHDGLAKLTARTIADKLGSSTSPIYSLWGSMEKIEEEVCRRSTEFLVDYQTTPRIGQPFFDMGLGYVLFAREEKQLFRDMFMNTEALKPFSRNMVKFAEAELQEKVMAEDPMLEGLSHRQRARLLETAWIIAHGLATQMNVEAIGPKTEQEIVAILRRMLDPIIDRMKAEGGGGGEG